MTTHLGGWQRIGVILSVLWVLIVSAYAAFEFSTGPDSAMLLIEMVVSKTGEPNAVLEGSPFRDLVPVEPRLLLGRFSAGVLAPVVAAWLLLFLGAWAVRWVATGFRGNGRV